eukprot:TRINITY_DN12397_c0_g1_i1.p1 TRINITY_DN12397_c0_g1~~TRINITY_DN12397_c0_g1_i1.p1  ORF type:complete len:157 (-),score=10.77 TRINITY_DN12397_c0_g1_i1:74-544(-)
MSSDTNYRAMSEGGGGTTINLNKVLRGFAVLVSLLCIATGAVGIWRSVGSFNSYMIGGADPATTTTNRNAWWSVFIVAVQLCVLGLSSVLAELGVALVRTHFPVRHYLPRAGFYAVMGILSFGVAGDLGFACTLVCAFFVVVCIVIKIVMNPPSAD